MPVGTQGSVKGMTPRDLLASGAAMILCNTYHLALRPGTQIVRDAGGLHGFTSWPHPILTDSGGYQVFSLGQLNRVDDDGVTFRSHIDGAPVRITPEQSISWQNDLGADVIMCFDECPPHPATHEQVTVAVERTTQWARRCRAAHARGDQALFGIVQGGVYDDLRERSAEELVAEDFPGYAIGGVSVGETPEEMRRVVSLSAPFLPVDRPRYVMGVGTPDDLIDMVGDGTDLFDCVMPTRNARNASLFTRQGSINMRNRRHAEDPSPVESSCECYTCLTFSRGYLRHLYMRGEMLGPILGTLHNLAFYQSILSEVRQAIRNSAYSEYRRKWREAKEQGDERGA